MDNNSQSPDIGALLSGIAGNPALTSMLLQLLSRSAGSDVHSATSDIRGTPSDGSRYAEPFQGDSEPARSDARSDSQAFNGSGGPSFSANNGLSEALKLLSTLSSPNSKPPDPNTRGNSREFCKSCNDIEPPFERDCRPPRKDGHHSPGRENNGFGGISDQLKRLLGGKYESENRICLINALRPYLSEDRRCKADMLIKILRLAELGGFKDILC